VKAYFGEEIQLTTRAGEFSACHVVVQDEYGAPVREGVMLRAPVEVAATEVVHVRVQSSCLFSESFWATDCDCALQLQKALEIVAEKGGLVLYFYEEGRGAGLATKFQAIRLQQLHALSTKAAYECLNLSPDPRSYDAAAAALRAALEPGRAIRLLSNNTEKAERLREEGINIVERVRLVCGWNDPAIRQYLREKRAALLHDIPDDGEE
jgi:GTP cyclohydrolase II